MTKAEQGIIETWRAYQHLDHLLSDRDWIGDSAQYHILADLWAVVKAYAEERAK